MIWYRFQLDDALDAVRRDLDMARSLENRFKEYVDLVPLIARCAI